MHLDSTERGIFRVKRYQILRRATDPQGIDGSSRRDFCQQTKSQQARAMLQQKHSTACEAGGTQIEPDGSIAPHAATLHSVAHSKIQFSPEGENLKDCCP